MEGLKPFKEGAAYIALNAGVPVVPVALTGTLQVLPMHSLNVRPGHVVMKIGDPIPTAHLTVKDRAQAHAGDARQGGGASRRNQQISCPRLSW